MDKTHQTFRLSGLISFLNWAQRSFEWSAGDAIPENGVLAIPPIQRNPAWNPRQVVDVWDSVLRGLPLGSLMIMKRPDNKPGRGSGSDAENRRLPAGWDLIDGQQRTRSLLLGLHGPVTTAGSQDQRCIWVDLKKSSKRRLFNLILTSAGQPFGYNENGYKFSGSERANDRARFEPDGTNIKVQERIAYTHEFFGGFIEKVPELHSRSEQGRSPIPPLGYPPKWPPLPHGYDLARAFDHSIFPLHVLLAIWLAAEAPDRADRLSEATRLTGPLLNQLVEAFGKFHDAIVPIVDCSSVGVSDLPLLYDRIGASGTPLAMKERLYSFYKYREPGFHEVVQHIYTEREVGRVLEPAQIAACAIRLAYAQYHHVKEPARRDLGNELPDFDTFVAALSVPETAEGHRLADQLGALVLSSGRKSAFDEIFIDLFHKLNFSPDNHRGIPTSARNRVPAQLVETLLFWRLLGGQFDESDNSAIKAATVWLLCTGHADKCSTECFRLIRTNPRITLRQLLIDMQQVDGIAHPLIEPEAMSTVVIGLRSATWRSIEDRVAACTPVKAAFIRRWWHGSATVLPILERAYLEAAFPAYDPSSDREDDTPYDLDHIVPQNDWGFHANQQYRLDQSLSVEESKHFFANRRDLGDSIGNCWLVDLSVNRKWNNQPASVKFRDLDRWHLRFLDLVMPADIQEEFAACSFAVPRETKWTAARLESFQLAVEARAARLYDAMFREFELESWRPAESGT